MAIKSPLVHSDNGPASDASLSTAKTINDLPDELITLIGSSVYQEAATATLPLPADPLLLSRRFYSLWSPLAWQNLPSCYKPDRAYAAVLFQPEHVRKMVRQAWLVLQNEPSLDRVRCAMLAQLSNLETHIICGDVLGATNKAGKDVEQLWRKLPKLKALVFAPDTTLDPTWSYTAPPISKASFHSSQYNSALRNLLVEAGVETVRIGWDGPLGSTLPWETLTSLVVDMKGKHALNDALLFLNAQIDDADPVRLRHFELYSGHLSGVIDIDEREAYDFLVSSPLKTLRLSFAKEADVIGIPSFGWPTLRHLTLIQRVKLTARENLRALLRFIELCPQLTHVELADVLLDPDLDTLDVIQIIAQAPEEDDLADLPVLFSLLHRARASSIVKFTLSDDDTVSWENLGGYHEWAGCAVVWSRQSRHEDFTRGLSWTVSTA